MLLPAACRTRPNETVSRAYIEAVERTGALALLFPNADPALAGSYLDRIDGLFLTGGDDPHPSHFGEEPHRKIEVVDARRDAFEIALVKKAHARDLPVLGVCRGVQIMNIALGGDIYQDIGSQADAPLEHLQKRLDDGPWHEVEIRPGTRLGGLLGRRRLGVNSFHHQACRRLGEGLLVAATATGDGLIEAVEDPRRLFFLGVQWHPELGLQDPDPLFGAFVEAARARARASSNKGRAAPSGR